MSAPITIWLAHWPRLHDPAPLVINARIGGGPVTEFRGPPYEHNGWSSSPAGRLHDALEGWHACILHAEGGPFVVHDQHTDYQRVRALCEGGL